MGYESLVMCYFVYFITFLYNYCIYIYSLVWLVLTRSLEMLTHWRHQQQSLWFCCCSSCLKKFNMNKSNTSHNLIVLQIINLSASEFMSPLPNCPPKLPLIYFHLSAGQIYTWGMYEINAFDLNTIWHSIWNVCPDI